jgi:hypothetical protein
MNCWSALCDTADRACGHASIICIDGVRYLIAATFVDAYQIKPSVWYIWIDVNGLRVHTERVTILIDLEI